MYLAENQAEREGRAKQIILPIEQENQKIPAHPKK